MDKRINKEIFCFKNREKLIDTSRPLIFSHYQNADEATINIEQDGNMFSFSPCNDPDYVSSMDPNWKDGMVYVMSLWGSEDTNDMYWLDDKTGCEPEGGVVGCDINNASVTFSNIQLI